MDDARKMSIARFVLTPFLDYEKKAPHVWSPVWLAVVVASSGLLVVAMFDMGRDPRPLYSASTLSSLPALTRFMLSTWPKMLVVLLSVAGIAKEVAVKNKAHTLRMNKVLFAIVAVLAVLFVLFGLLLPLQSGPFMSLSGAAGGGQP